MSVDSIVNLAVSMQSQSLKENISMSVTKMALDRMEKTGQDIMEMMDSSAVSAPVSLDPSLGNLLDIAI